MGTVSTASSKSSGYLIFEIRRTRAFVISSVWLTAVYLYFCIFKSLKDTSSVRSKESSKLILVSYLHAACDMLILPSRV